MNRKIVSLTTAVILTVASAVPVFAAGSPSTATVMTTVTTVPAEVAAAKGLDAAEQAAVATTVEQAVALASGVTVESSGTAVNAAVAQPGLIALAKADILKDAGVQKALKSNGVAGLIVNAGMLARADGKSARTTINLSSAGLVPGEKVAILYYIPGDPTPHVVNASWKNGKIQVTLPLPCVYSIVK